MKKVTFAIWALVALLLGSNAWWAAKAFDGGISYTYLRASYDSETQILGQIKAVLGVLTQESYSSAEVLAAAQAVAPGATPYEKFGYTWVGQLGLRFDEKGKLSHVITREEEAK